MSKHNNKIVSRAAEEEDVDEDEDEDDSKREESEETGFHVNKRGTPDMRSATLQNSKKSRMTCSTPPTAVELVAGDKGSSVHVT